MLRFDRSDENFLTYLLIEVLIQKLRYSPGPVSPRVMLPHHYFCYNLKTIGFRPIVSTEGGHKCVVSGSFKHKMNSIGTTVLEI